MENLTPFIAGLIIIFAVISLLMPVFVMHIRGYTRSINKKMDRIIKLLEKQ